MDRGIHVGKSWPRPVTPCDLKAICVDAIGRRCANGRDFKRADDEGAFPVRYFWDCWPAPTHTSGDDKQ